jgi:ubiquinone/menaquinone biosynthesis C-methylase UbiE
MDRRLLKRFLELYPFQPATAVWRAAEVAAVTAVAFPQGRGLDLGCGDGRLTRVIMEQVGQLRLVGLDVDPQETALAENEHLYEAVHTSSATTIPAPDASFDFVMSISVMEHIQPLEAVLSDVARVLKPGGQLITTVPAAGFHGCLRGPLLPGESRADYLRALDRRVAHLRYWTIAEWRSSLEAAGLRLVDAKPILARDVMRRWETLSRMTAGLLHMLAGRRAPIEIQRSLGLRRAGQRLPAPLPAILSRVLALGLRQNDPHTENESGCLLVIATRPAQGVA